MADTLNSRFLDIVERRSDKPAFLVKRGGEWKRFSYRWTLDQVRRTAFGLRSFGYEPGTRLGILSENRPEWATSDFGAMAAGYVLVPLYTTLIPQQIEYILNDAEVKVIFVSTMRNLETILSIRDKVPSLEKIVVFYPEDLAEDDFVIPLDRLKERGEARGADEFQEMSRRAQPEDPATFVYTSGTTGNPKGVVLSHANLLAEFEAIDPAFEGEPGDVTMSFLPLSHILQRVADTFSLLFGMSLAYAESIDTLGPDLREVRPTHIVAVPRVYEKIHGRILEGVEKGSALKKALFNWAVGIGGRFREAEAQGRVSSVLALRHSLATALVFKKIHAATGGNIKFYASTGAPLERRLAEFFHAVGIKILEVYGMTELSGAVTINTASEFRFGSVGKPGPGVEIKISDEGEICVQGGVVMREYWKLPEATAETIDPEGWLHTGDVGTFDGDGFLHITDRIKELVVTAGGKNVAPQPLENALKSHKLIAQASVIGDQRKFVSALIVPEKEVLEVWAEKNGIAGELATLCNDERVIAHYETIVQEKMRDFSKFERVKKFALIPEPFTQEGGELTPTLKLKRRVILAKYQDRIEALYA